MHTFRRLTKDSKHGYWKQTLKKLISPSVWFGLSQTCIPQLSKTSKTKQEKMECVPLIAEAGCRRGEYSGAWLRRRDPWSLLALPLSHWWTAHPQSSSSPTNIEKNLNASLVPGCNSNSSVYLRLCLGFGFPLLRVNRPVRGYTLQSSHLEHSDQQHAASHRCAILILSELSSAIPTWKLLTS